MRQSSKLAESYARQVPLRTFEENTVGYISDKTMGYNWKFYRHLLDDIADPLWMPIFKERLIQELLDKGKSRQEALKIWDQYVRMFEFVDSHSRE